MYETLEFVTMATDDPFTVMIAVDRSSQAEYAFDCEYRVVIVNLVTSFGSFRFPILCINFSASFSLIDDRGTKIRVYSP